MHATSWSPRDATHHKRNHMERAPQNAPGLVQRRRGARQIFRRLDCDIGDELSLSEQVPPKRMSVGVKHGSVLNKVKVPPLSTLQLKEGLGKSATSSRYLQTLQTIKQNFTLMNRAVMESERQAKEYFFADKYDL